ncbi:MAG: formylglycine-generating enzyme family protein [Verrucomicrobia bacterium]|nr:formylglycine-generating enzyme family protein [Verrucomicrobiota bacterium]
MKRSDHKLLGAACLFAGVLLTSLNIQTAAPALSYEVTGNNLILTYTGTLLRSSDSVTWTEVQSATSPYKIALSDKKLFFCAKASDESVDPLVPGQNGTVSLPGGVYLDLNWIEPGTFTMGSPSDELGRSDDEIQHKVTLSKGYWLGKYEVTQAQYKAVMETNPSHFTGDNNPVDSVSWEEAMAFCTKLTEIEQAAGRLPFGYEYTLPTEAQWEYACRAGTTTALNSGKNLSDKNKCPEMDEVGWYDGNSSGKTHPVGQKQPNAKGLYDMHGNVLEWCLDWYKIGYPINDVTDPTGPDTGTYRVNRGGSWWGYASSSRSAFRGNGSPSDAYSWVGFRVALAYNPNITIPLAEDVDLDMIWIKSGTFTMGSPEDELGRYSGVWEDQHEVTLTQGYWLGKYEVTQAQYKAIMKVNPSKYKGADRPVECVSWNDAMAFCAKLTEIEKAAGRLPEGYEFTLPTEAQWEYACRAGTTTALNSGKNLSDTKQCSEMDEVGWYYNNSEIDGKRMTHPVGQKQPNAWELYDMHGNVCEWCLDWYGKYPTSSVTDPTGASTGKYRVERGGNWAGYASPCRSANRGTLIPDYGDSSFGFRVALAPVK